MSAGEWKAKYINRLIASGIYTKEFAEATYEAGAGDYDFTDDPEMAADDEISYIDND